MDSLSKRNLKEKKEWLRKEFRIMRKNLSSQRKKEAAQKACQFLIQKTERFSAVCSFESHHEEIDLTKLNLHLANKGKLLLPKIKGRSLQAYIINNLEEDLEAGAFNLMQPKDSCQMYSQFIPCILVPAVAFDQKKHRLGFGHGFYDRFLAVHQESLTLGIGYKEQLSMISLPIEAHDIPIKELCLF
ncbi:MAG: 5-formyltetrahydrofolate cyclo-ligase [Simkaniaceae bacterium]